MPEQQAQIQCGCCYDWEEQYKRLSCGHSICQACYQQQDKDIDKSPILTRPRQLTCVLHHYKDWYNIDVFAEDNDNEPDVRDVIGARNDVGSPSQDENRGNIIDDKLLKFGCRMCQNLVFNIIDPAQAATMPIFKQFQIIKDATEPKPCETTDEHIGVTPIAKFKCLGCNRYICEECKRLFHRADVTIHDGDIKGCRVFSLDVLAGIKPLSIGNGGHLYLRQDSTVSGCVHHNGQEQTFFCRRCRRLACQLCLKDSSHAGHPVDMLGHALGDIKEMTKNDVDKLTDLHRMIDAERQSLQNKQEEKMRQFETMDLDAENHAADLCAKIEEVKTKVKAEIDKERARCLEEIQAQLTALESRGQEVRAFGEAVHTILNADLKVRDIQCSQTVMVQQFLAGNREQFDALQVPEGDIELKRTLQESADFKPNRTFMEHIAPTTFGHIGKESRETFLLHAYDVNETVRPGGGMPPNISRIVALSGGRISVTDKANNTVKMIRSSSHEFGYRDDWTVTVNKVKDCANIGRGYILVIGSTNQLTLLNSYGQAAPLPNNCGPPEMDLCSVTCLGDTLYFGCYNHKSRARKGIIFEQDFGYEISTNPNKSPFCFSICEEFARVPGHPDCLAVKKGKRGKLQMVIGIDQRSMTFIRNNTPKDIELEGGEAFKVFDVCFDHEGDVLVADGHRVLLYGITGALRGIVVGPEDGIKRPVALAMTEHNNDLIIGDEETGLKSFVLSKKNFRQVEFRCKIAA